VNVCGQRTRRAEATVPRSTRGRDRRLPRLRGRGCATTSCRDPAASGAARLMASAGSSHSRGLIEYRICRGRAIVCRRGHDETNTLERFRGIRPAGVGVPGLPGRHREGQAV
jgi:hypothetical protein